MSVITKIDVIGDSILKGVVLDDIGGRYRLLKTGAVKAFSQLFSIDVKNHSHFGCTAPKALASLDRTLAADEGADLVLLEFGGNDCDFNWAEVSKDPTAKHNPNTPYEEFVETMQSMIRTCRSNGCTPVLMSLPPIDSIRFFDWITRPVNVDPEHIMEFLGDKDYIYRHQERYSRAIVRLAYENMLPLVDVRDAFLSQKYLSRLLCADGIHPTEAGQKLIEDVFAARYLEYRAAF